MSKTKTTSTRNATSPKGKNGIQRAVPVRKGTKLSIVITHLSRPAGTTIAELVKATNWQPHTVRSVLSRTLGKDSPYKVISSKGTGNGLRVYRIMKPGGAGKK